MKKRNMFYLIISVIVVLIFVGGAILKTDNIFFNKEAGENEKQIEQSVLFEYSNINFAAGFSHNGWFIDNLGNVILYEFKRDSSYVNSDENQDYLSIKELNKRFKKADKKKIYQIDPDESYEKYQLMQLVTTDQYSEKEHTSCDAGGYGYSCYVWDEEKGMYKEILLSKEGDLTTYNLNPAAIELTGWLEEIKKNISNRYEERVAERDIDKFLSAVGGGLKLFSNGRILVAVICYLLIVLLLTGRGIIGGKNSVGRITAGSVLYQIRETLILAFLLSMLLALLLPILLGYGGFSLWVIFRVKWVMLIAVFLVCIVIAFILFLPFIGRTIANLPGMQTFIAGVIIYKLFILRVLSEDKFIENRTSLIFPSIPEFIGILVITGILAMLIKVVMIKLAGRYQSITVENKLHCVGNLLGMMGGLIPLFMYINYIRISLLWL